MVFTQSRGKILGSWWNSRVDRIWLGCFFFRFIRDPQHVGGFWFDHRRDASIEETIHSGWGKLVL